MTKELSEKHKKWIKGNLIPNLVKNKKLLNFNILSEPKVKVIEIEEISHDLAHSTSICYCVKILLEIESERSGSNDENDKDRKEFHLIVKTVPDVCPEIYKQIELEESYANEILAYEQVIPKLKCLSKAPKYYYSHNQFPDATIVLSDFTKDGWKLSTSKVNLSLDHIFAAVKHLGEFHGNMYALKLTVTDIFDSLKGQLRFPRYQDSTFVSPEWILWNDLALRRATNSVRASKTYQHMVPESFLKYFEELMYETYSFRRKCIQPIEPFAILCHGDYLRNNIAFRYDADGKAVEAMMFDFQTMCYTSPMIDLSIFMANSIGHQVRDKHFNDIFDAYHESLIASFLTTSKWTENDIPEYLNHEHLLKEYARCFPFGISIATMFLPALHSEIPNFFETKMDQLIRIVLDLGGDKVDEELGSLVVDFYRLHKQFNLT